MDKQNAASTEDRTNTFWAHGSSIKSVEITLAAILPTAWEEAAAEKCHFTNAENEDTI